MFIFGGLFGTTEDTTPKTEDVNPSYIEYITPEYHPYINDEKATYERKHTKMKKKIKKLSNEIEELNEYIIELEDEIDEQNKARVLRTTSSSDVVDTSSEDVAKGEVSQEAITFEATYYTAFCPTGCTGVTATGVDVSSTITHEGKRIIAVDPNVIPIGSTVHVTTPYESFYATAQDTGGDIKGNRIDILVDSPSEASRLGRHNVQVNLLK